MCIRDRYYPPQQRHQVDHWKTTVTRLTEWLHATIQQLPRRCLVIVGTDANCEFGKTSSGNGSYQYTADGIHVGSHNTAAENYTSAEWWRLLQMEGLTVVDTHFPTGPTYYGQEAGHRSHPDHFIAPRDTIEATLSCCSLMGAMRDLQLIPHADPKDHAPMLWRLKYRLHYQDDHEGDPTWDYDRLAGLAAPRGDHDLVGELERLCENAAAAWRSSSRQDDPSEAWQSL
eukprot:47793-Pyramimonas_sp.AAC.1